MNTKYIFEILLDMYMDVKQDITKMNADIADLKARKEAKEVVLKCLKVAMKDFGEWKDGGFVPHYQTVKIERDEIMPTLPEVE